MKLGSQPKLPLSIKEEKLFQLMLDVIRDRNLNVTIRAVGGWVRDKLLERPGNNDIDFALDTLTGEAFAKEVQEWSLEKQNEFIEFRVIQSNPDKSKHLETGTLCFYFPITIPLLIYCSYVHPSNN